MATSLCLAITKVYADVQTWSLMLHSLVINGIECVQRVGGWIHFHDIVLVNEMINNILVIY